MGGGRTAFTRTAYIGQAFHVYLGIHTRLEVRAHRRSFTRFLAGQCIFPGWLNTLASVQVRFRADSICGSFAPLPSEQVVGRP